MEKKAAEQDVKLTPTQTRLCNTLELLYTDYSKDAPDAPSVSGAAREQLRAEMGWFGDLALAPEGADADARNAVLAPATWTMAIFFTAAALIGIAGFVGLFGLVVFVVLLVVRKLRGGLTTGSGHGGVYAETFAVWFVLFSTALLGGAYLPLPSAARLPVQSLVMLSSLMAVGWPVLRGVPWSVVRREIGWTLGRRPWLEPFLGLPCYLMSLPILAVGLVVTLILAKLSGMPGLGLLADASNDFRVPDTAGHPIVGVVAGGSWYQRLIILWLASFVAPVVEETMFRGVLYRHLRELTGVAGPWVSVAFSGTVVSFIFAVIHPQGLVAVPVLMAMAYGFTIAREWRETLIPAMVAHGLNNGLVLGLLILVLSR
jgi:membrane protease YdiL (CAAX protease family)